MKEIRELYQQMIMTGGFDFDSNQSLIEDGEFSCTLPKESGEGIFWNYFYENMFVIQKQDFLFYDDFFLEASETDFMALQYYFSVSGEEFSPYLQLSPNSLRTYVGGNDQTFHAVYHKNIPIRSISISIMPDFYDHYLREKLGGEYISPQYAFKQLTLSATAYPQIITLLKQIFFYSGHGMSAKLFYEGKVLEALALIMDEAQKQKNCGLKISITKSDIEKLKSTADYIDHHLNFAIPLDQLCRISYMGKTKLKSKFKEYFGCNISNYIIQKRVEHAQHLLIGTELSISEISQAVGYDRPESFARQFQKITGLLPRDFRKTIQQNQ